MSKSTGVGFEDPPARGAPYDWEAIARRCKRRPNKWYTVFERDKFSYTISVRSGVKPLLPIRNQKDPSDIEGFEVWTENTIRATATHPRLCKMRIRYYKPGQEQ
jgi:hypothetical protein